MLIAAFLAKLGRFKNYSRKYKYLIIDSIAFKKFVLFFKKIYCKMLTKTKYKSRLRFGLVYSIKKYLRVEI